MTSEPITRLFSEAIAAAIPEGDLTVSGWAETYRYLAPERSARPGRWSNDLVPYARAIMDAASRPDVRELIFMKSAQVAGSEIANNIIGYYMHIKPSPILYVCETEQKAKSWSQESLAPMIRDTPVLNALVEDARSRDSGNTIDGKKFPGGHLAVAWATSAATLSSRPRRIVIFDEVDAFGTTQEGDPISLGEARTKTFEDRLIVKISTPRDEDTSRIKPAYESSYKGTYFVPCPHCGEFQPLVWANVKWDGGPYEDAYYVCEKHGCVIEHEEKADMLAAGEWRFEGVFQGSIGFFIWEGYSPFVTWGEMVIAWHKKQPRRDELRAFVNTSLAQTWQELGEVKIGDLPARCEDYGAEVPDGVVLMTAGVDIQGDRIEYEIVGWGLDDESWSINYDAIYGDPSQKEIWEDLKLALTKQYLDAAGVPRIVRAACIDTGGHHTDEVVRFCRANRGRRFWAIKGANTPGKPIVPKKPSQIGRPPVNLWLVGTETAKDTFTAHLKLTDPGPGYCHFPEIIDEQGHVVYDEAYFKQLCSEKAITKYVRGVGVRTWQKIKESLRNEALDCRVYAMAAKAILNPDMRRETQRRLARGAESQQQQDTPEEKPATAPRKPFLPQRRTGGFVNNWKR